MSPSSMTTKQDLLDPIPVEPIEIGPGGPDQKESLAIQKAIDWLREKRLPDYSWGNDTHMVILAKELSGPRDPSDNDNHLQEISDLENMLSVKQMEIELLTMVDRHHAMPKPINTDRIAKYILAMGALCKDARHFFGHDLVAILEHHEHEEGQEYEFALTALAVCSSATHVRKRQIRRLLDIASGEVNDVGKCCYSTRAGDHCVRATVLVAATYIAYGQLAFPGLEYTIYTFCLSLSLS